MRFSTLVNGAALVAVAAAADSICDKYTKALLKDNSAANQEALLVLVVNTAVIGNYTQPNVGIAVPGILAPGTYDGTPVNLLPYFDGTLQSTNNGGKSGASVNFLDGGGATPLEKNKPGAKGSNQYTLLTHLYEYFAVLLGCSKFGTKKMPYAGSTNMYEVHQFMTLNPAQVGYFIEQVGLSAASFGVSKSDVKAVGSALNAAFGYRDAAAASIPPDAKPEPQSICIACSCPIAEKNDFSLYGPNIKPVPKGQKPVLPGHTCYGG